MNDMGKHYSVGNLSRLPKSLLPLTEYTCLCHVHVQGFVVLCVFMHSKSCKRGSDGGVMAHAQQKLVTILSDLGLNDGGDSPFCRSHNYQR